MSSNRPSLSPLPAKSNRTLAIPRSHSLRESSVWTKLISFRSSQKPGRDQGYRIILPGTPLWICARAASKSFMGKRPPMT